MARDREITPVHLVATAPPTTAQPPNGTRKILVWVASTLAAVAIGILSLYATSLHSEVRHNSARAERVSVLEERAREADRRFGEINLRLDTIEAKIDKLLQRR